jgi:hypothetical protein
MSPILCNGVLGITEIAFEQKIQVCSNLCNGILMN